MQLALRLSVVLAAAAALAPPADAQAPKKGDYYVDEIQYGFRVRTPKDWSFSPPKPGEDQVIGKYGGDRFQVSPGHYLDEQFFLIAFDERPGPDGEKPRLRYDTIKEFIDARLEGPRSWALVEEDEDEVDGMPAVEYVFEGPMGPDRDLVGAYAMVVELEEGLKIGICGNGPGDRKWSKYERAYGRMGKSFGRVELEELDLGDASLGGSLRDRRRRELLAEIATQPGWRLLETENYFVVTNSDDDDFVEELMDRIEAIRDVYEVDYPAEKARLARQAADGEGDDDDEAAGEDGAERTESARADPLELSRTSIVRVCATREDYLKYDAPPGSGGYWSSRHEELVVYNKKAVAGEDATWETLSHEAFHQYIYYFYGSIAPHPWYNEGTGDYYGGHEYKRNKFIRAPRRMRKDTIKEILREERTIPLKEFVRWEQPQYYGSNSYGMSGFDCYAQGWSFVYFLRCGDDVRGFEDEWETILPTYLEVLARTGDLDEAIDQAFAGVDWEELEEAWKDFVDDQL